VGKITNKTQGSFLNFCSHKRGGAREMLRQGRGTNVLFGGKPNKREGKRKVVMVLLSL